MLQGGREEKDKTKQSREHKNAHSENQKTQKNRATNIFLVNQAHNKLLLVNLLSFFYLFFQSFFFPTPIWFFLSVPSFLVSFVFFFKVVLHSGISTALQ